MCIIKNQNFNNHECKFNVFVVTKKIVYLYESEVYIAVIYIIIWG